MISAVEATLQRRATKQFIDANPTVISLFTVNKVMSGGTMKTVPGATKAPQRFRVIWLDESGIAERPPEGTRKFNFVIVGQHDAAVDIGDYWKIGNQEYRIEAVTPSNGWEVKAYGISYGPKPT